MKLSRSQQDVLNKMADGWGLWSGQNTGLWKDEWFVSVRRTTVKILHLSGFIQVREFGQPTSYALTNKGREYAVPQ